MQSNNLSSEQKEKFLRLHEKYSRLLLKVALESTDDPHLAHDAVQQTYERVLTMIDKIREGNQKETGGLLIRMCQQMVHYLYSKKIKAVGKQPNPDEFDMEQIPDESTRDIMKDLIQKESTEELVESLSWLHEDFRNPLIYRYVYDMTTKEIAEMLGINENLVYSRIHRAKLKIKNRLKKNGGSSGEGRAL